MQTNHKRLNIVVINKSQMTLHINQENENKNHVLHCYKKVDAFDFNKALSSIFKRIIILD